VAPANSIPEAWLEVTAEGWPGSSGYGSSAPVLSRARCILTAEVTARGEQGWSDLSGWGAYGPDASADDAYRYVCGFDGDELSAQLQILQADSPTLARATVDDFLDQPTTRDQENESSTVLVGEVDVHVNVRWYPTPEYGEVTALFEDEEAVAIAVLEVSSLDADEIAAYTPEQAALDLMTLLARG